MAQAHAKKLWIPTHFSMGKVRKPGRLLFTADNQLQLGQAEKELAVRLWQDAKDAAEDISKAHGWKKFFLLIVVRTNNLHPGQIQQKIVGMEHLIPELMTAPRAMIVSVDISIGKFEMIRCNQPYLHSVPDSAFGTHSQEYEPWEEQKAKRGGVLLIG